MVKITNNTMIMSSAKRRLAQLWFIGVGTLFFLVFILSAIGRYGDNAVDAWAWFLPTIMPTLSLIVGVFVLDVMQQRADSATSDPFFFKLTFWLSAAYLIAVLLVLTLPNLAFVAAGVTVFDFMNQANLWLGPFQGLVAATMGAFFVKNAEGGPGNVQTGRSPVASDGSDEGNDQAVKSD